MPGSLNDEQWISNTLFLISLEETWTASLIALTHGHVSCRSMLIKDSDMQKVGPMVMDIV